MSLQLCSRPINLLKDTLALLLVLDDQEPRSHTHPFQDRFARSTLPSEEGYSDRNGSTPDGRREVKATIPGTRPEIVKLAPVIKKMERRALD